MRGQKCQRSAQAQSSIAGGGPLWPTCRRWAGSNINLTGDYNWRQNKQVEQGDFRPLQPLVGAGQERMEE